MEPWVSLAETIQKEKPPLAEFKDVADQLRDIAEVPAVEVITTTAVHLMSAAAVQCGLTLRLDGECPLHVGRATLAR